METNLNQKCESGNKSVPVFSMVLNNPAWLAKQSNSSYQEPSSELPTDLGCKNLSG